MLHIVAETVERWPLERLRASPNNPRVHPESQIAKLMRSLQTFGFTNPILADESGEIVAGEARWIAAQRVGFTEAPVIVLAGLGALEREAYRIADNRLAEDATWDEEKLAAVMRTLEGANLDMAATGFTEDEILELLAPPKKRAGKDPDAVVEVPPVPVTELGDVWELGPHRLVCGDSTKPETLATLMGGRLATVSVVDSVQADLVFTDPPYGMSYKGKTHGGIIGDDARGEALLDLVGGALKQAKGVSREGAAFYVCLTWRTYREFLNSLEAVGLKIAACIVWNKGSIGPGTLHYRPQHEFIFYCRGEKWLGGYGETDVWDLKRDNAQDYVHPTQKPTALIERAIENSSRRGDVVLDVFGGSGSTLIACERTQRIARLVELDPRYCDAIVERWKMFTGMVPVRRTPTPAPASASAKQPAASA